MDREDRMYRVIVVDDEPLIRERICKKMDWESIGYELVGRFENGLDAKEYMESNPVDMVLTDICMPYMDGIALSEYIYTKMPKVKVIIFSGFDDFEYAQKAIHYQVEEYLLKPVTLAQLSELLLKQKKKLDEERAAREKNNRLNRFINKNQIYLQSGIMRKMMNGSGPAEECLTELREHGIVLEGSSFYAAALRMQKSGSQSSLFQFIIYNIVSEIVRDYGIGYAAFGHECEILILFYNNKYSGREFEAEVASCLEKICSTVPEHTQIEISAAAGTRVSGIEEISDSYREVCECFRRTRVGSGVLWAKDELAANSQNHVLMLAMEYILENYNRPELTLTEVCSHFGVSVTRFSANFKARYDETFSEALVRIRMAEAKKLLSSTHYKNYEIAERCGYTDPHYFGIVFKKATGKTPAEWRKEYGEA